MEAEISIATILLTFLEQKYHSLVALIKCMNSSYQARASGTALHPTLIQIYM